jgi:hypothetical protein
MNASPQELLLGARISGAATMLAPEERRRHCQDNLGMAADRP